ncbi:YjcZ family sporulation protein [Salibacterium aidingense]|nr:YjcZ family sporulation protein [Salibacterium aidingense]
MYNPYNYGQGQVGGYSTGGYGGGKAFALIVVLFILLVIVGASRVEHKE